MCIDLSDNIAHEVLLAANNCMFIPPLTPQLQKKAQIDNIFSLEVRFQF